MKRNWAYHLLTIVATLTIGGFCWWLLYDAQFLPYDDNYSNLGSAFGLSTLVTTGVVIAWFLKRNWVKVLKWEIAFFLLTCGPLTVALVSINYRHVFGAPLQF